MALFYAENPDMKAFHQANHPGWSNCLARRWSCPRSSCRLLIGTKLQEQSPAPCGAAVFASYVIAALASLSNKWQKEGY
ncbi:hypothetical protein NWF24_15045 [Variovorax paradoxus]|uniref:hypothetical protein n=1 Tax=Variovorax paradoxus TaxID=34073 RepID=UPI0021AC145B|nr:hypothetical protein [Variovorax paradoxus]UVH60675.1 hypothetical protein NWF24_15045 [Variovorax paradoxus]